MSRSPIRASLSATLPLVFSIGLGGCTALDLWDAPVITVEPRACNEDAACANVQFTVSDSTLLGNSCLVPARRCDTSEHRCTVALEARDTDGDGWRDIACKDVVPDFSPRRVDCDDHNEDAFPRADHDDDGFFARGCAPEGVVGRDDCDDDRATAFPGQTVEACDGVVSTCTDATPAPRRVEEDFDNDRAAPAGLDTSVCVDVSDADGDLISFPRTDCDDADPLVYAGADDVCDGRNNDCSSIEGVGVDALEDVDDDGFSSPATTACDSTLSGGFPNTDCDDANGKTFPGAPESCDLIINDCSARTGFNISRLSEDPDRDAFFAADANCIDPVANIECKSAGFDAQAQYCPPGAETVAATSIGDGKLLLAADFDGNGTEELSWVNGAGCSASADRVYFRVAMDSLAVAPVNACDVAHVVATAVVNVDVDATLELITLGSAGAVTAYDVTVSASPTIVAKTAIASVTVVGSGFAVGQVDGAGAVDFVAVESTGLGWRSILTNGTAASAQTVIDNAPGTVSRIALGDVTNDGLVDVVTLTGATVRVYTATSAGAFGAPTVLTLGTLVSGLATASSLALGDVEGDGDGDLDIVLGSGTAIAVLARHGASFESVPVGVAPNGMPLAFGTITADNIAIRDLDGDGRDEILFASTSRDTVGYVDERASGVLSQHAIVSDFDRTQAVTGGDFDGDGDVDVAAYSLGQSQISRFTSTFVTNFSFAENTVDRAFDGDDIELGDIDEDGLIDVVGMTSAVPGDIHVWRTRTPTASAFDESIPLRANVSESLSAIALGDANGDGRVDIAVVSQGADSVGILRGNGDTTFAARDALATFDSAFDVELGDLDDDGVDELVVVSNGGVEGRVAIYSRALGSSTYTRTIVASGSAPCVDLDLADVDADRDLDIAIACGGSGLFVLTNPGIIADPWTELALGSTAGHSYSSLTLADIDRNESADVIAFRSDGSLVAIYDFAAGTPSATPDLIPVDVATSADGKVETGDLDGDGDVEILVEGLDPNSTIAILQTISGARARFASTTLWADPGRPTSIAVGRLVVGEVTNVVATIRTSRDVLWWSNQSVPWWNH